ncbi:MAG: hypothetical protein M0Z61_17045 [Nitrospiraceae bacterium]|nr:hypothetical protein [Nitrospiraceae bacterium]
MGYVALTRPKPAAVLRVVLAGLAVIILICSAVCAKENYCKKEVFRPGRGVKVTVTGQREFDSSFSFDVNINRGLSHFKTGTFEKAKNCKRAVSRLKKVIGWKGRYFFVREDNGGNGSFSENDAVFMIKRGGLIFLGRVYASQPRADQTIGPSYNGEYFTDIYDKFDLNPLTDIASAPGFWLVIFEKEGRFQVDAEKTWLRNKKKYDANIVSLHNALGEGLNERLYVRSWIAFDAVLAKYCGKEKQLKETMEMAGSELGKERVHELKEMLSQVIPSELLHEKLAD